MAAVIRDTDRGAKDLLRRMKKPGASMLLGVQGREAAAGHGEDGLTVGEVASQNELGLGVPERSFLRAWVDENQSRIEEDLRQVYRKVILGHFTAEHGLQLLAVRYVGELQAFIASGIPPENAPYTIAKKGSSTPLIDTGQLRSAITFLMEHFKSSGFA